MKYRIVKVLCVIIPNNHRFFIFLLSKGVVINLDKLYKPGSLRSINKSFDKHNCSSNILYKIDSNLL